MSRLNKRGEQREPARACYDCKAHTRNGDFNFLGSFECFPCQRRNSKAAPPFRNDRERVAFERTYLWNG